MKSIKISDSEWEVMNLVWKEPGVSSSRVVEVLSAQKDWRSRTVRTLLDRLVKKGALKTVPDGKRNLYHPAIDMQQCIRRESRSFAQRVFGGEPGPMLLNLVREADLSQDEIERLKRILEEKEK
jgi:BlaI family transcriptional regulator, penicillinase repressor